MVKVYTDCSTAPYTPTSTDFSVVNTDLLAVYTAPSGYTRVMKDNFTLDANTGHVPTAVLQSHYTTIQNAMSPPPMTTSAGNAYPQLPLGSMQVPQVTQQIENDRKLMAGIGDEYCFYYKRYAYALAQWIKFVASTNAGDNTNAALLLDTVKTLNARVIFIVEFMNYITQVRIPPVTADGAASDAASIKTLSASLDSKIQQLQETNRLLTAENAIVTTQKEMVRYTSDKNSSNAMTVGMWIAVNVVAVVAIGVGYTML
jgi:hypothetical protein